MTEIDQDGMPFVFDVRPFRWRRVVPRVMVALLAAVAVPSYAAAHSAPAQSQTTLHTSANLVVLDVTVSDARHDAVHHLAATDFTVLEDGKPQTVTVFEEHGAGSPAPAPLAHAPRLAPGAFTNESAAPQDGALNILMFDQLNTPATAQADVRAQVLQYLRDAPAGTRMAIFSLTTELKLLQGFTTNPELLRALVEGKKGNPGASAVMNDPIHGGGDQPGSDDAYIDNMRALLNQVASENGSASMAAAMESLQQFESFQQSLQLQIRVHYTLDALNQLAHALSGLPGRKNLIWFSGSFPLSILPDPDLPDPFADTGSQEDEFRETIDLLSRGQVSVYPIDARGGMPLPIMDASNAGGKYSDPSDPNAFNKDETDFFDETAGQHDTMREMAEATGGEAFLNTNGLKEAVEQAVNAGSNYYTVAYTPTDRKWNGKFRKIQVKLDRRGVTLAYRRGYFADDPNAPLPGAAQSRAIRVAMQPFAPEPTGLIFVAKVQPTTTATEAAPSPGNQPGKTVTGPYRRYTITFSVDPNQVSLIPASNGARHVALDFLTFVYGPSGTLINMQTNRISGNIPAKMYQKLEFHQQISVPVKGAYDLRIGMRDDSSDRVGALEMPVAAVANLPPFTATVTAPAPPK